MSDDIFDGQLLAEKLSKVSNTQQSIQSLSRWCISHQKRAKEIVETWVKLFNASQKDQRIAYLHLANDILQNSRRKGSEFVNEFWKVLPEALRRVCESNDDSGKKAVARLVEVWEERKVFGSRLQGLKDEIIIMGKVPPPSTSNGKISNSIKIAKRDGHVRIKLAVGCLPEKILSAFQPVLDEHLNEEAALKNCSAAVHGVGKVVEDVENTLSQGNQLGSTLVNDLLNDLQEQEKKLKQYIEKLEKAEAARDSLLSQLKHALQEQESRQELVHSQLLVARGQIEKAVGIKKRLNQAAEAADPSQAAFAQSIPFAPFQTTEDDNKKAKEAAAAVAAKLAASASSAQMLTSVFCSFVAEEAASLNGSLNSTGFSSGLPIFNPEKRPKLEKPTPVLDVNSSDMTSSSFYAAPIQQPSLASVPLAPSVGMQTGSQANQLQAAFASAPPPPPHSSANQPSNQYVQSTGLMAGGIPYGYGPNGLPPPPPLPPHVAMGLSMPGNQSAQQQQQSSPGGYYRPPGIGFYGQSHPSTPPPVPRQ
ncbi:regulation of nuclear pre-mRNA domain-containing protein 2 [Vigna radiata var. radiata]|uniref:Regulation of nuclear pre-mRNA domain-containing protein 2 n=1 Tax=Vigna radiata var. radiata TaxID=3916 RepID=A0A1S3TBX5_VIGRR|nr:regulation of nuclear pre-mRNA domain-containing protein 2 [Vigna radiata var. radiata]XP_014491267.1 regulation of nuclear pre-mRNA domain-containing protein 2 [Vigna radiata var. radiata]